MAVDSDPPHGWTPSRGIPPAAGSPNRNTPMPSHMRGTASSSRMSPRGSGRRPSSPRGRGPGPQSKKEVIDDQKASRHHYRDFRTEQERSYQDPENHDPIEDEYGRPIRRLYSGRIKKRVDLKHEGESDEIIYQYTGEGTPTPNKYAIDEIYPEKFDDAAGQPSKTLFAKNARMRMVEYFPEKDIKAYLGGEADELMFGHSVAGAGVGEDQYEVREVPDLIPQSFMSAAGLTSKELQRHVLKEKINQDGPETMPHVADAADEVMYGRRTNRHYNRVDKITDLPLKGMAGFRQAAGMASKEAFETSEEPLELKLEQKIVKDTPPYLGGEADEVIYGRQMGGNRSELNEIKDLRPRKFSGAAGLTSNEVIKANPDLEHYIIEQPPGSSNKIELRRGGEMAERLGSVDGEAGDPLRVVSSYPENFIGAAGMNSNDLMTKSGSAEQMIFRLNPQSGLATGGEAAQAIYGNTGDTDINSFTHKEAFEISSVYPRAYRGVAGSTSRNLFKNSPEAGGRHLFSENLKDRVIGKPGHGTDAKPKISLGASGLTSKDLFKGHKLNAIGDTPREMDHDKNDDGIFDHLRDEEADIVLYGADLDDSELRKVGGIPDRNPPAFDGAAGLSSRQIFRVMQEGLQTPEYHPEEHKLGQARWGGEMEGTMYGDDVSSNRSVEYQVHKLAPDKYADAAGLTSKVAQAVREEGISLDDARGKRVLPNMTAAPGNPNAHARTDLQNFAPQAHHHAAGLSSIAQHSGEEEDAMLYKGVKVDNTEGGEAASVVFGKPEPQPRTAHKSIAGLTSRQVQAKKKSGFEARTLDVRTMRDPGGSEAHDTMYGKLEQDVEYDGNEEPRINELPETYPENYAGAAGLATKEVFRQQARPFMFGEKTSDGMEYGAKHISELNQAPNPAALNSAFMHASHWFEPDYEPRPQHTYSSEELEQAKAAYDMQEESRRHKLYQSHASYGVAAGYDEDGRDGEEGAGEYQRRMEEIMRSSEEPPAWARQHPPPPTAPPSVPHGSSPQFQRGSSPQGQRAYEQPPVRSPVDRPSPAQEEARRRDAEMRQQQQQQQRGGPASPQAGSPMDRLPPGERHKRSGFGLPPSNSESPRSRQTPRLFEKGSFAHQKLEGISRSASGETPLSGRGSARGSMGAFSDFAARVHAADSQRSQRSARSYRG